MKSLYQFRLLDELKASDTQVRISDLIGWKDEHQLPKKVEFEKETIVFQNGDGSVFEMAFWSAQNWIMTLLKRGLDENNPPTEKEYNKKTWGNGTKCYITAGAGDFIDKDETGYWNGKQIFEAWVVIKKALEAEGQIDAKRGIKHPTFATKEEATAYFTEAEKVEWLLVNIAGSTCRWNSTEKEWNALGNADINEEKVLKNSEKIKTLEEKVSTQEQKVGKLEEAGTPDHLWIKAIVAEAFKENDEAYEYHLPLASEVTSDCPIWQTNQTKEIHIPRVSTGVSFNTLDLYLKKVGEPSQNLEVEIRKAKKVSSLGLEFVVGNEVLATGSVRYSEITTAYQMKTITLSKEVSVVKDEFIIIVLKQQGGTVNWSNYFCIWVSKNPSLWYGVVCVEDEQKQNKTYANVVCNSLWWNTNAIFWLWGSSFKGHKKWTLPDRYNFSNWFPKNSIQEIVAPADNLTIKFKVKCSNWKTSGWGGSTRWGFSIILWNQTLASYGYNQTVETTTTATLSTRMLESSELYIQGNSENYSTYYTGCDVEISREITSKPWEILARSIYSRKAVSLWEKWEFTVFGCHQDMTWKWEDKLPAWPFIVALSGYKSWNSTDTKQFKCPKDSFCKMGYNLSSNYYWDSSLCHIKLKKDWKEIQSLSRNSNGSDSAYFILPKGVIDVEIYSWNTNWGDPSMSYSILIQTDLPS